MGFVTVLRELWFFRAAVTAAAVFGVAVGVSMMFKIVLPGGIESRQYNVGVAEATALLDTPRSQVADLGQAEADVGSLSVRSSLLASLMTSSPLKERIATNAGIAPGKLIAIPPSSAPTAGTPAPVVPGVEKPNAVILRASVPTLESGEVPIISVDTQAPAAADAAKLADEAVAVLRAHLETVAGTGEIPEARRIVVRPLGPARASTVRRGPTRLTAVIASFAVFIFGCAGLLGLSWLVRAWRTPLELDDDGRPAEQVHWDELERDGREEAPPLVDASAARRS